MQYQRAKQGRCTEMQSRSSMKKSRSGVMVVAGKLECSEEVSYLVEVRQI
jgi:hypothetical protein